MPSRTPPTGRMKKPTPNVAVVSSSEAYWLSAGKKSRAMITEKKPKTMKSYHSRALPTTAAAIWRGFGVSCAGDIPCPVLPLTPSYRPHSSDCSRDGHRGHVGRLPEVHPCRPKSLALRFVPPARTRFCPWMNSASGEEASASTNHSSPGSVLASSRRSAAERLWRSEEPAPPSRPIRHSDGESGGGSRRRKKRALDARDRLRR